MVMYVLKVTAPAGAVGLMATQADSNQNEAHPGTAKVLSPHHDLNSPPLPSGSGTRAELQHCIFATRFDFSGVSIKWSFCMNLE